MNKNTKFALVIFGASILGSVSTIFATQAIKGADNLSDDCISSTEQTQNNGFVRMAAHGPAFDTDFTVAAEKTINAVVSVKTYATPRVQQRSNDFFIDPFEFFFGPGNGGSQRRQQQQQQESKPQQI